MKPLAPLVVKQQRVTQACPEGAEKTVHQQELPKGQAGLSYKGVFGG